MSGPKFKRVRKDPPIDLEDDESDDDLKPNLENRRAMIIALFGNVPPYVSDDDIKAMPFDNLIDVPGFRHFFEKAKLEKDKIRIDSQLEEQKERNKTTALAQKMITSDIDEKAFNISVMTGLSAGLLRDPDTKEALGPSTLDAGFSVCFCLPNADDIANPHMHMLNVHVRIAIEIDFCGKVKYSQIKGSGKDDIVSTGLASKEWRSLFIASIFAEMGICPDVLMVIDPTMTPRLDTKGGYFG